MINLKIKSLSLLAIIGYSIQLLPNLEQEVSGRTELINYVIQQEDLIKTIDKEISELDAICYETETFYSSNYHHSPVPGSSSGSNIIGAKKAHALHTKTLDTRKNKKNSCTSEDLEALKQKENDLKILISSTVEQIDIIALASNPSELGAEDSSGKTALNYCYTKEIYNKLREVGIPFQYRTWFYFNKMTLAVGAMMSFMGAMIIPDYLNKK